MLYSSINYIRSMILCICKSFIILLGSYYYFRMEKLIKIRDSMTKFRRLKLNPIERGWSGARMPGRSIGPPDAIGEGNFKVKLHFLRHY